MKKQVVKKKAKAKSVKSKSSDAALSLVNFKVSGKDRAVLTARAKKYADGSLSAWLRHVGVRYVPKSGEVIRQKAK